MAEFNFVADYNDQFKGFECLPAGEYKVQIVNTDVLVPDSGDGKMLMLEYEVVGDPQYDGRKFKEWLKYMGSGNVSIGVQKINTIFFLTGLKNTKDSVQLQGKTLSVLLSVKPAGNDKNGVWRDAQNEIKKHLPFNSAKSTQQEENEEQVSGSKPRFVK